MLNISNRFPSASEPDQGSPSSALLEDHALLVAFTHGDRDALATLYRRHSRAVFQFAFYMAGSAEKADELTQEVFVWLIHHPAAFQPARGSLPAFLGGVARKFLRRQQRTESRWFSLDEAIQSLQAISVSRLPLLDTESALDAERLRQAVALLPTRYREAIVLCDLQEKEYAEAAQILGCSVGTIRSRLHRGRNLLVRKFNLSRPKGGRHAL